MTEDTIIIRLRRRWLHVAVAVAVTAAVVAPVTAYASHQFDDVPDGAFHDEIAWLADNGITVGCNDDGSEFCPEEYVKRQQMAAFLYRLETEGVFLPADGKAANADLLDGRNSSSFLGVNAKAANADLLDGRDLNAVRYPTTLDGGQTVRGHFAFDSHSPDGVGDFGGSIDFGIDTGGDVEAVYVEPGSSDPDCRGSWAAPTAPAGFLCLYTYVERNVTFSGFYPVPKRFGAGAYFGFDEAGDAFVHGTWAVTAPRSTTAALDLSPATPPSDGKEPGRQ